MLELLKYIDFAGISIAVIFYLFGIRFRNDKKDGNAKEDNHNKGLLAWIHQ